MIKSVMFHDTSWNSITAKYKDRACPFFSIKNQISIFNTLDRACGSYIL